MTAGQAAKRPGPLSKAAAWRLALRLPTLPAAVAPVLAGTGVALADDTFDAGPASAALVGALLLQVAANLANDVFDFRKGADTADRLGPPRVTQSGFLSEREVVTGLVVAIALAMAVGVYLAAVAGWPVIAIGAASIVAALAYTGGPWPFGYHALGDLFTFVFFGVVAVAGTYYVQSEELTGLALGASLPLGCTVTAILVVNNLRDIPTDSMTGKRTLGVLMGEGRTRAWYALLAVGAFPLAVGTWVVGATSPWVLLVLPAAIPLLPPLRAVLSGARAGALNPVLKQTARFHLVFGLLFAAGLALS